MQTGWRWLGASCVAMIVLLVQVRAMAHDLAIDQLVLWPDPKQGSLRGEITFDPELTRAKTDLPTAAHEAQVSRLLRDNLRYEIDGRSLEVEYQIRELWVAGGATAGDLVVFSAKLPPGSRELRVHGGAAFKALAVTVTVATADQPSQSSSWLLGRDEWTPVFSLDSPAQTSGWRPGGPEQFAPATPATPQGSAGNAPTPPLPEPSATREPGAEHSSLGLAWRFLVLGFEHILPGGVDHMLFVAGLVLGAARRFRHILISLTSFTLAHTVTLGLGNVTGYQFAPGIVEPLIALSIAVVGLDNLRRARSPDRDPSRWRHAIVFGFGLIHGMGFANALTEMTFARQNLLLALFSFNLGVELGQVAVVVLLLGALHWVQNPRHLQRYVIFPGSAAIALSGLLLVIERVVASG